MGHEEKQDDGMAPMSIAALRRRLAVGTELTIEYIGTNLKICKEGAAKTRRRVIKCNTSTLITLVLEGPNEGKETYCDWAKIKARQDKGGKIVILQMLEEDFLKLHFE